MEARRPGKRPRSDSKGRGGKKRPAGPAAAAASTRGASAAAAATMVPLDSFRHAMLRVPGGELVDAFVADGGLGAKDGRAVLVVFDSVASESDILSAISGCGEVASARTAPLPVAEGVSDWAALLVVFEEDGALERVAKAGKPPAQAGEDGALVGMASETLPAGAPSPRSRPAADHESDSSAPRQAACQPSH